MESSIVTIILGVFCVSFGIYTAIMRKKSPEKFGKLVVMKEKFGNKAGNTIHLVFYTFLPIFLGLVLLMGAHFRV